MSVLINSSQSFFWNLCVSCLSFVYLSYNSISIYLQKRDIGKELPGVIYFLHTRCSFQSLWLTQSFTCLLRWARVGPISANWAGAIWEMEQIRLQTNKKQEKRVGTLVLFFPLAFLLGFYVIYLCLLLYSHLKQNIRSRFL